MKLKKLSLVTVFILIITACSGNSAQLINFLYESTGDFDFEGTTFRIFHDNDHDLRYVDENGGATTTRHEKLLKRLDEIENKYNCTM